MDNRTAHIDLACYQDLLDFMNVCCLEETKGDTTDMDLFHADTWLIDSAVIDRIVPRKGIWEIFLVFAFVKFPFKVIMRKITTCLTIQKAEFTADKVRRLAAKDQRGTLKIDESDFNWCLN